MSRNRNRKKNKNTHSANSAQNNAISRTQAEGILLAAMDGYSNAAAFLGEDSPLMAAGTFLRSGLTSNTEQLTTAYREFWLATRIIDTPAQFGRELPLLLNSGEYGLLAAFEFLEFGVLRLNGSNLQFIERASALLAVARDKRDSGTLVQQTDNGLHLLLAQTKATTDNG